MMRANGAHGASAYELIQFKFAMTEVTAGSCIGRCWHGTIWRNSLGDEAADV
jgi:hypothetical protein